MRSRMFVLAVLALACVLNSARAQDWPRAPVKIVVPVGPGLATDVTARMLADSATPNLGVGVAVENITGGSGALGAQTVARAAPDGYTLLFANSSALTSNMYLLPSINYDPLRDFAVIALVSESSPFIVSVNKDVPVHSIAELIAYGKAHPGALTIGIDGTSGYGLVTGRLLNKRGEIGMVEASYRATPQMLQDLVAGRIQVMIAAPIVVRAFLGAGQLRAIGITSGTRFPGYDVPTVAETLPGFLVDGWFALVAPAKTPYATRERMHAEVDKFLEKSEPRRKLLDFGVKLASPSSMQAATEFVHADQDRWRDLAKELDLKP